MGFLFVCAHVLELDRVMVVYPVTLSKATKDREVHYIKKRKTFMVMQIKFHLKKI